MVDEPNVKQFGYRQPRVAVPCSLRIEVLGSDAAKSIRVRGIDISASGIAIAVGDRAPLGEPVELSIRYGDGQLVRVRGHVSYQAEDHYGLEFSFETQDQRQSIDQIIAPLVRTV